MNLINMKSKRKKSDLKPLQFILNKFDSSEDKYISREFQSFGIYLSEQLDDSSHKSLYIKLAKTTPRYLLEEALSFVKSTKPRSKGRLFMWKLVQLKKEIKDKKDKPE